MQTVSAKLYAALMGVGLLLCAPLLHGADAAAPVSKTIYKAAPTEAKFNEQDMTFCLTFDRKSAAADFSLGNPEPFNFKKNLEDRVVPGFDMQNAFNLQEGEELKYDVIKNIDHRQGTITMWLMAQDYSPKDVKNADVDKSHKAYLHILFKNGDDWVRLVAYQFFSDPIALFYWQNSACEPETYRVASVPLYDVGQGEWFQLAVTWDDKKIKIYRNGNPGNEVALPEEAQKTFDLKPLAAESFIGVRLPMFDPSDKGRHTVIDDIKIYNRVLSADEIKNRYLTLVDSSSDAREAVKCVGIQLNGVDDGRGHLDRLEASLDYNLLPKEWYDMLMAKKLKGEYTLMAPSGKIQKGSWNPQQAIERRILNNVTEAGKYDFATTLTAPDGRTEKESGSVVRPDTSWFGNKLGLDDTVPAPWTPISITKDNVVKVWNREYHFHNGPFPSKIIDGGENLLAKAPELLIETEGGAATIAYATAQRAVKNASIELAGTGAAKDFSLAWRTHIDFDGVIWSQFAIKGCPKVKSMKLVWTVEKEFSRYLLNPLLKQSGDGVFQGSLGINAYNPSENNMLWLTSETRGFGWSLENDANWVYKKGEDVLRANVNENGGQCEIAMITTPVTIPEGAPYHAIFVATPSRPLPDKKRTYHLGSGRFSNGEVQWEHHGGEGFDGGVFSFRPDPKTFATTVAAFKTWGPYAKSILPYGGATALNDHSTEGAYFRKYWSICGASAMAPFKDQFKKTTVMQINCCPATSYSDFILSTIKALFDDPAQMHSGIYYDLAQNYLCGNELHGHKFNDRFGRSISSYIIMGLRRHIMRTMRYCHERGRVLVLHDWSRYNPVIHGLGDYWLPGEQYCDLIQRKRSPYVYFDDISDDEYRSELNMRLKGSGILFLGNLKRADKNYGTEEQTKAMCTKLLLNDIPLIEVWVDGNVINRIWGIQSKYRLDDAESVFYYSRKNKVESDNPQVAVTYYKCPDGNFLAIIGNLSKEDQTAEINLGHLKAGLKQVRDEYEESDLPVQDGKITLAVKGRQFHIIGF